MYMQRCVTTRLVIFCRCHYIWPVEMVILWTAHLYKNVERRRLRGRYSKRIHCQSKENPSKCYIRKSPIYRNFLKYRWRGESVKIRWKLLENEQEILKNHGKCSKEKIFQIEKWSNPSLLCLFVNISSQFFVPSRVPKFNKYPTHIPQTRLQKIIECLILLNVDFVGSIFKTIKIPIVFAPTGLINSFHFIIMGKTHSSLARFKISVHFVNFIGTRASNSLSYSFIRSI